MARFITTIKNITVEKKKNLIIFHSANKINNGNRAGEKRKKKIQKNLQNKSKLKNKYIS